MDRWNTYFKTASSESGASRVVVDLSGTLGASNFEGCCVSTDQSASVSGSASLSPKDDYQVIESDSSDEEGHVDLDETSDVEYSYSVKVISPGGKGGYEVHNLESKVVFSEVSKLKETIVSNCKQYMEVGKELRFGYIVPGHGKKGKQLEVTTNENLKEMYERYKRGRKVMLWMKQCRKRPHSESENASDGASVSRKCGRSSYDAQLNKMVQVDEILEKIKMKHGGTYSPEQCRVWALLIQMGKHDSYDCAPDKLFFKNTKKRASEATASSSASPGKRLQMRSECIEQLDKWYQLMEKGAITAEQYKEIQDNIMNDIKKV